MTRVRCRQQLGVVKKKNLNIWRNDWMNKEGNSCSFVERRVWGKKKEWLMQDIGFSRVLSRFLFLLLEKGLKWTDGQREAHIYLFFFLFIRPSPKSTSDICRTEKEATKQQSHCCTVVSMVYFSRKEKTWLYTFTVQRGASACVVRVERERERERETIGSTAATAGLHGNSFDGGGREK